MYISLQGPYSNEESTSIGAYSPLPLPMPILMQQVKCLEPFGWKTNDCNFDRYSLSKVYSIAFLLA